MKKIIILGLILFLISPVAIAELYRGGTKEVKIYMCYPVIKEYTDNYIAVNIGVESRVNYNMEITVTAEQQDRNRKILDSKTTILTLPAKAKREFSLTMINWDDRKYIECTIGEPIAE